MAIETGRTPALAAEWRRFWDGWWASARTAVFPPAPQFRMLTFRAEREVAVPYGPLTRGARLVVQHQELEVTCRPEEAEALEAAFALGGIEAVRAVLEGKDG